jgi:hypothetical protein
MMSDIITGSDVVAASRGTSCLQMCVCLPGIVVPLVLTVVRWS